MPAAVERKCEGRAMGSDVDNDSSGTFNHNDIAMRCCVGLMTRDISLEHVMVRKDVEK